MLTLLPSEPIPMEKPETLVTIFDEQEDVKIFEGFKDMPEKELKALYDSLNLAMTFKDFFNVQLTNAELEIEIKIYSQKNHKDFEGATLS